VVGLRAEVVLAEAEAASAAVLVLGVRFKKDRARKRFMFSPAQTQPLHPAPRNRRSKL